MHYTVLQCMQVKKEAGRPSNTYSFCGKKTCLFSWKRECYKITTLLTVTLCASTTYIKYTRWSRGTAKMAMHTSLAHEIRCLHRRTMYMYAQVPCCWNRCLNCVGRLAQHHGKVIVVRYSFDIHDLYHQTGKLPLVWHISLRSCWKQCTVHVQWINVPPTQCTTNVELVTRAATSIRMRARLVLTANYRLLVELTIQWVSLIWSVLKCCFCPT